jgi:hypothetical protein
VTVFHDATTRAEQGSRRIQLAPERDEIVLISSGSVQNEESAVRRSRDKLMDETEFRIHSPRYLAMVSTT